MTPYTYLDLEGTILRTPWGTDVVGLNGFEMLTEDGWKSCPIPHYRVIEDAMPLSEADAVAGAKLLGRTLT